jgi:hypothetical protein
MRAPWIHLLLLGACASASTRARVAETPSAQAPARIGLAPPASDSDEGRYRLVDEFDEIRASRDAWHEARVEVPPPPPRKALPPPPPPVVEPKSRPASPEKP